MRPTMKSLFVSAFMLFATIAFAQSKEGNNVLFENDQVRVTYHIETCAVANSDLTFEYYLVEVTNKTDRKINLQYWSKPKVENPSQESFHSIILLPNQELTTPCDENNPDLRFYRSRPVNGESIETMDLQLNAFEIFQL